MIIIVLFILGILFLFYFSYNNYYFMNKDETINFILNDNDNYIKNMSIYDLYARKVKSSDEYKNKIKNYCINFTNNQKNKLIKFIKIANNFLNKKLFLINKIKWKFALIENFYEEGFPHTREDIIFLSPNIFYLNSNEIVKILIHERIHIFQRNIIDFNYNYLIKNNYKISRIRNTELLIRANPDLDKYIYTKNNKELLYIYKSYKPNSINDIYKIHEEHPFETMAEEISNNFIN
jgi:hypothetical protein